MSCTTIVDEAKGWLPSVHQNGQMSALFSSHTPMLETGKVSPFRPNLKFLPSLKLLAFSLILLLSYAI